MILDVESTLRHEIQEYEQQLLQQAPNLDRDEDYIKSMYREGYKMQVS